MKLKRKMGLNMFDLLKGIIIILVVIRHSVVSVTFTYSIIGKSIYSIAMPALFLVSGYWLNKRDIKSGLMSGIRSLLIPFLIVISIIIVVGAVYKGLTHAMAQWLDMYLLRSILVMSTGGKITYMWFVFSLFVAWCIYYVAVNALSERGQMAAACLCAVAGGLTIPLMLPFQISQGLIAFFYVYAGYQVKKRKLLQKELHPLALLALLALWAVGMLFGSMELSDYRVHNFLLSVPGGLCGAYLLVRLFLYLNSIEWRILDPVRWVGRYSMWILCIHTVEAAVFPWRFLLSFAGEGTPLCSCLLFVLRWFVIVAACQVIIRLKQRGLARGRGA